MRSLAWIVVSALLLAAGCQKEEAHPLWTLHEIMKDEVEGRAAKVRAIGNALIKDDVSISMATMTDRDWEKLASASTSLQQAAHELATMPDPMIVTKPGVKISDEGVPDGDSAASVQAKVDKDPQGFRNHANALAQEMADLAAAANDHDAAAAGLIVSKLNSVCESCHLEFWAGAAPR